MDLGLLIVNPERAEAGPGRSGAESKLIRSVQYCCYSAKHSSPIPHLIGYRVSINISMLGPDFLPCYLLKGLSERRYEDCTFLEHPDQQRVGIMPAEITEVWGEKSLCPLSPKLKALPESRATTVKSTVVAMDKGKAAAQSIVFVSLAWQYK